MPRQIVSVPSVHGSVVDLDWNLGAAASHYWDYYVVRDWTDIWTTDSFGAAAEDFHGDFWYGSYWDFWVEVYMECVVEGHLVV